MSLTHRDTPRGPVLRLPWALLLAPVFLVGFLAVVCLILAVRVLLALEEVGAAVRRWGRRAVLLLALARGFLAQGDPYRSRQALVCSRRYRREAERFTTHRRAA